MKRIPATAVYQIQALVIMKSRFQTTIFWVGIVSSVVLMWDKFGFKQFSYCENWLSKGLKSRQFEIENQKITL